MHRIKRNDLIGMGASVALHLLLVLAFTFLTTGATEMETIGFIEVELGPVARGRPVQRAVENQPNVPEKKPEPKAERQQSAAPPKESKPVNLPKAPKEVVDQEKVQAPKTETVSPERQNNPAEVQRPEPKPESKPIKPLGGGDTAGDTGATEGRDGDENEKEKSSPYQIEGLNRSLLSAVPPAYREKVNATVKVNIVVDPQGRVTAVSPALKGTPALDQAVMDAVKRWRFNPLPSNVPQVNQRGAVTVRFRLE